MVRYRTILGDIPAVTLGTTPGSFRRKCKVQLTLSWRCIKLKLHRKGLGIYFVFLVLVGLRSSNSGPTFE